MKYLVISMWLLVILTTTTYEFLSSDPRAEKVFDRSIGAWIALLAVWIMETYPE